MTDNVELVTVEAGGQNYGGWKSMSVKASIREAARTFTLSTTERAILFATEWAFPPGTPIKITTNEDLLVDGYVNSYAPSFDANSHAITIEGRSAAQDLCDCAAVSDTGYWENKTVLDIAKDLDKFGAGVTSDVPLNKIPMFNLYQGETAFEAIERAMRQEGVTGLGEPRGMKITNAKAAKRHAGGLREGVNILRGNATLTDNQRHSEVTVKGQRREGTEDDDLHIEEKSTDGGVKRYRPKILVAEGDTDKGRARERAKHETNRGKGLSVKATITTQGFRDDGGSIWLPNKLVYVWSPTLKIDGDLLIENVTYDQDGDGGSLATLSLVNAAAYQGDGGTNSSSGEWQ